jgi:hypothetical protein
MQEAGRTIRNLLSEQSKLLCDEALGNGGQVAAEKLEALARLQKLVEVSEATAPAPTRKRWIALVALLLSLAIASFLLFVHLREAEVDVEVVGSEVGFTLADHKQVLAPGLNLLELKASGLRKVTFSNLPKAEPGSDPLPEDPDADRMMLSSLGKGGSGTVTLSSIPLPAGTRVRLRANPSPGSYRLSLKVPQGTPLSIPITCMGRIQVTLPGARPQDYSYAGPGGVRLEPAADEIDLDLTLPDKSTVDLSPQLRVSDIAFVHIDQFQDADQIMVRYISSINSGVLYMESLNGEKLSLRSGEGLRFEASDGEMRKLSLEAGGLSAQYQGRVRGMTTGSGQTRINLMPPLLEWLRARHGLSLLWGTTLYLSGLVGAGLRWLKVLP